MVVTMQNYLAHSRNKRGKTHSAKEHLADVAKFARIFAGKTPWRDEAALAGILHDLGKYADLFQARLRGEVSGLDHWSMGSWMALKEYHSIAGALAIQGHHIGLQQGNKDALSGLNPEGLALRHPLNLKLSDHDLQRLNQRFQDDGLSAVKTNKTVIDVNKGFKNPLADMIDVRMLFSCVTDADFLDTEAHFEGDEHGKQNTIVPPVLLD